MIIYVLMKDGKPLELTQADIETVSMIEGAESAMFAVASTNRRHVAKMRDVLPDLLDWDEDESPLHIAEFTLTDPAFLPV